MLKNEQLTLCKYMYILVYLASNYVFICFIVKTNGYITLWIQTQSASVLSHHKLREANYIWKHSSIRQFDLNPRLHHLYNFTF